MYDPKNLIDEAKALISRSEDVEISGDCIDGLEGYQKGLEILQILERDAPLSTPAIRLRMIAIGGLGRVAKFQGRLDYARSYFESALQIAQTICAQTEGDSSALENVSISLVRVGDLMSTQGLDDAAKAHYEDALQISDKICEIEGHSMRTLRSARRAELRLVKWAERNDKADELKFRLEKMLEISEKIVSVEGASESNLLQNATDLLRLSWINLYLGKVEVAIEYLEIMASVISQVNLLLPRKVEFLYLLFSIRGTIALLAFYIEQYGRANLNLTEGQALVPKFQSALKENFEQLAMVWGGKMCIGLVREFLRQYQDACDNYSEAIRISEVILEAVKPDPVSIEMARESYMHLAFVSREMEKADEARQHIEKALKFARQHIAYLENKGQKPGAFSIAIRSVEQCEEFIALKSRDDSREFGEKTKEGLGSGHIIAMNQIRRAAMAVEKSWRVEANEAFGKARSLILAQEEIAPFPIVQAYWIVEGLIELSTQEFALGWFSESSHAVKFAFERLRRLVTLTQHASDAMLFESQGHEILGKIAQIKGMLSEAHYHFDQSYRLILNSKAERDVSGRMIETLIALADVNLSLGHIEDYVNLVQQIEQLAFDGEVDEIPSFSNNCQSVPHQWLAAKSIGEMYIRGSNPERSKRFLMQARRLSQWELGNAEKLDKRIPGVLNDRTPFDICELAFGKARSMSDLSDYPVFIGFNFYIRFDLIHRQKTISRLGRSIVELDKLNRQISIIDRLIGDADFALGQFEMAKSHYQDALKVSRKNQAIFGETLQIQQELTHCLGGLAKLARQSGNSNEAFQLFIEVGRLLVDMRALRTEPILANISANSVGLCDVASSEGPHSVEAWSIFELSQTKVNEYIALNDPEAIVRARPLLDRFHCAWLGLALKRSPKHVTEVLGVAQGRKVTMLVMDELHRQARPVEAVLVPEFEIYLESRERVNDLSLALGGGVNASSLLDDIPSKMGMGGMQAEDSAETIRNRTERLWVEYRDAIKSYEAARAVLIAVRPELADIAPAEADRYQMETLRKAIAKNNALLILVQSPKESEHPCQAYALLIKANDEGEHEPVLRALPGLQTLPSQLRAYRKAMTGVHRSEGAWRDCEGLTRASEAESAGSEAETLIQAIEPEQGMRERLWKVLQGQNGQADLLEGLEHLHIVSHGELHNLPLALGAPEGLSISQYPGLVYYWMVHNRKTQQTLKRNALDHLRMQVYSPEVDLAKGETTSLNPIPHVQTEAELVGSCWAKRDELLKSNSPDQPATVLHLACHGTEREGQEDPCLILSPKSKLNLIELLQGAPSAPIVYLSACLVGQTHEDLDGDPLGLVGGFMVRGAQCVIAALNPINDFWAPLLAYLFHRTLQAQALYQGQLNPVGALADAKRQIQEGSWVAKCVHEQQQAEWQKATETMVVQAYAVRLQKQLEDAVTRSESIGKFLEISGLSSMLEDMDAVFELIESVEKALNQAGELVAECIVRRKEYLYDSLQSVQWLLRDVQAYGAGVLQRASADIGESAQLS